MRDVHDELRARLREAAEAHEPDRAHILARIERGMAEETRPTHRARRPLSGWAGWARLAGATAAVAGVLGVGGYAVASAVRNAEPADRTVVVSPTPVDSPDATSRAPLPPDDPAPTGGTSERPSGTPSAESSEEARDPEDSAPSRPPVAEGVESGPLWSDGSVDPHSNEFWAQSNLTLKTREELTALTVELRVALTDGVTSTGAWRSLPEQDFTLTVEERDGFLVYRWVLVEGRTVPAGEWVFAGQYDHARGGRDAGDDAYTMTATADGEQHAVGGDFARQDDGDDS